MSRSGYIDDCDGWELAMWRGQVTSATRGKRGQKFFRDLAAAMDAMPVKELVSGKLQADGKYCALGVVGAARGVDLSGFDQFYEDEGFLEHEPLAKALDIAHQLAQEVMFMNDEAYGHLQPKLRWEMVRKWVQRQINTGAPHG